MKRSTPSSSSSPPTSQPTSQKKGPAASKKKSFARFIAPEPEEAKTVAKIVIDCLERGEIGLRPLEPCSFLKIESDNSLLVRALPFMASFNEDEGSIHVGEIGDDAGYEVTWVTSNGPYQFQTTAQLLKDRIPDETAKVEERFLYTMDMSYSKKIKFYIDLMKHLQANMLVNQGPLLMEIEFIIVCLELVKRLDNSDIAVTCNLDARTVTYKGLGVECTFHMDTAGRMHARVGESVYAWMTLDYEPCYGLLSLTKKAKKCCDTFFNRLLGDQIVLSNWWGCATSNDNIPTRRRPMIAHYPGKRRVHLAMLEFGNLQMAGKVSVMGNVRQKDAQWEKSLTVITEAGDVYGPFVHTTPSFPGDEWETTFFGVIFSSIIFAEE